MTLKTLVNAIKFCNSMANIILNKSRIRSMFALALTVVDILIFYTFELENLDQGHVVEKQAMHRSHTDHFLASSTLSLHLEYLYRHVVEKRDLCHSMGNVNLHKSHSKHFFALALTVWDILIFFKRLTLTV